ncbi:MAG: CPBP family intramembrane metalloprotease [Salinivirgaceae bacterium]|nr:CPBP family intramembrane metalloprotease [Salinivirgaceae bacterium]
MKNLKLHIRKISLIIGSIIIITAVPILLKEVLFKPLLGLLNIDPEIIKNISGVISTILLIVTYYFVFKIFEKRKILELSPKYFAKESIVGFAFGFMIISLIILGLFLLNSYSIISINNPRSLYKPLIVFTLMGIWEEIIFRGIIYRITENWLGTVWALIISSLVFGFVHLANDQANFLSGIGIALELGLLTGITFTLTRRLWVPLFLHIGWNYALVFYGAIVSGANEFDNFIESNIDGATFITGGEFGPENSIITILLSIIIFSLLYKKAIDTNKAIRNTKNNN